MSINIFTTSSDAGQSTTDLNGQFVFSQVLIDCLLRLKYTPEDKKELISFCKNQYKDNDVELNNIREFKQEYSPDNVVWWYTRESFFYKTLNAALRTQNIHLIFLFRAYISDIHRQLRNHQARTSVRVYRSQMISNDELKTLKECRGKYISVNSFFSTSTDYEQALSFLDVPDGIDNLVPVVFDIDANPQMITTKSFADISEYSEFNNESEILFMLGSIFRLQSVKRNSDDQVWIVRMILCNENEYELKHVLEDMIQQLGNGETNLYTLGKLLWQMGKFYLAETYFNRLLDELPPNDPLLIDLYERLAILSSQTGNWNKSVKLHENAMALKKKKKNKYQVNNFVEHYLKGMLKCIGVEIRTYPQRP